jgi:hypothetical protein
VSATLARAVSGLAWLVEWVGQNVLTHASIDLGAGDALLHAQREAMFS